MSAYGYFSQSYYNDAINELERFIVKYKNHPQIPYAYYLHAQGKLDTVITSRGMKPFYYFCDDVREEYQSRTINNEAAGLNRLPNNWIHGIDSMGKPGVLDYREWISPPYKDYYKNS